MEDYPKTIPKKVCAFFMPDGNTWVGKFTPDKPNTLEDIIIFKTPLHSEDGDEWAIIEKEGGIKNYFLSRYNGITEGRDPREGYNPFRAFPLRVDLAIYKLTLEDANE